MIKTSRPGRMSPLRANLGDSSRFLSTSSSKESELHTVAISQSVPVRTAPGQDPKESDSSQESLPSKDDADLVVSTSEPRILHPSHPLVTYDPSRATATPVMTPQALAESLPLFDHRTPLPGHMSVAPGVAYTTSPEEADDLVACLRGDVLGLDLEWPPPGQGPIRVRIGRHGDVIQYRDGVWDAKLGKLTWPQGRTSVIQVCDGHLVVVLHLLTATAQPGPGLVALLADSTRIKTGVAIRNDALKLVRDFAVCAARPPAGLLELSKVARAIEPDRWRSPGGLVSLQKLCQGYLGRDLDKGIVRYGAWNEKLDKKQIDYAVNDVVVSYLLYNAIMKRAGELDMAVDARQMITNVPGLSTTKSSPPPIKTRGDLNTAFARFVKGEEVAQLATALGVKETVVQNHILLKYQTLELDALDETRRRGLLEGITRGSWVATKFSAYLTKVRKSLEEPEASGGKEGNLSNVVERRIL